MKKVKGYIERKTMLYKTGVEYGDYTMNHIQGCAKPDMRHRIE